MGGSREERGEVRALRLLAALGVLPVVVLGLVVVLGSQDRDDVAAAGTYGTGLVTTGIPAEVLPWIVRASEQCPDVSAPLLAAQLEAESGFAADARSPAGAQGIAQFLPATWQQYGRDEDGNGFASPFDVGDAVMTQGRYMCELFGGVVGFQGDRNELALAAYNAGLGNVTRFDGVPPFAETRAYIARIAAGVTRFTAVSTGPVTFPLPATAQFVDNQNFGSSGSHWSSRHTGNDFSTPCGTPVLAANAGTVAVVTDQGWSGPWLVQVATGPGRLTTWYAHMMRIVVTDGQVVQAGQQIGFVGTEGNSSGCHLHLELHPRGGSIYEDATDPVPWLREAGAYPG
ncbi:peptidoglycan DD-metalloendopeptidase family protein [Solicola sp. PLA-1-18]|uniref:peptidoglycan DD-metalloendopeptidase family protein n=1 Tax=Solicola sp. PLA-1-18 TaxID=3380532 RepID=UPI003B7D7E0F